MWGSFAHIRSLTYGQTDTLGLLSSTFPSRLLPPSDDPATKMKGSLRLFSAFILVLLLFMAAGMGPMGAEARTCETQSHRFKGPCVRQSNCAAVCQTEGFSGGKCRGLRRRCFCTKPC